LLPHRCCPIFLDDMGDMEKEVAAQVRRTKINSAIIGTVAVAGIVAVGVLAPNVLGVLGKTGFIQKRKSRVESSFSRLIRTGYIVLDERNGKKYARLTPKGEMFAARIGEGTLAQKKPKRWDGKWRVLVFDIPETRKRSRNQVRLTLTNLGFRRLQDSVWVYPYDCEDLIMVLKADLKLGRDVLYVIADRIENDKELKNHFRIS
jgi:CRISPR-associated endonuclease Cas2